MPKTIYKTCETDLKNNLVIFWSNLARVNNLLVIMNISMFFLTGLIAQGYYFTFISLTCLGIVGVAY